MFDDEEDLIPQAAAGAYDDNAPAIDVVLNHRLREGVTEEVADLTKDDFEYFIKWVGKAHYHATWQPTEELGGLRGAKKLKNYFDKTVLD